ncbi:unnamed protein product [Linum tenue]|uniref:Sugar phosphate transporter domain-containing protein n=1 Tax=Linum tenue TaxID=586396 RepID=A0AAV0HXY7_9ROSI|nr:unnamed protein product [Linum tenue]
MDSNEKLPFFFRSTTSAAERKQHIGDSAAMSRKGVVAATSYMATAVLLFMFNKAALSTYGFPYANVITLFQMICSCIFLYAMKYWKVISFTATEVSSSTVNPAAFVPLKTLAHTTPLAFSYLLYMLVTMESVRGINVPMYTTFRRTTVAFTMVVEYLLTGKKHSLPVLGSFRNLLIPFSINKSKDFASVGIIILGAFVAGARDLSFDAYSYCVVFVANICTAIYLASIARIGKSSGLNSFGLMWCNGVICLPALLVWTSDFRSFLACCLRLYSPLSNVFAVLNFAYWKNCVVSFVVVLFFLQAVMLLSCILAFLINYFVFLNTAVNSAVTQSICGNLKDLFTIGLGWMLFGGLPFDLMNILGQFMGFLGSCLYAYCKLQGK